MVVGEVDVLGEGFIYLGVEADAVGHVGKVGLARIDAGDDIECGGEVHV